MITEQQRQARRKYIGSSDIAALFGVDPWRTATDIYLSKTAELEDDGGSEAMQVGNRLESAILDYAEEQVGPLERNCWREHGILAANHDVLVIGKSEGVEAKCSSYGDWGEPGTDEVPEHVLLQCQHQALVSKLEIVHVPALLSLGGRLRFVLYRVERDEDLIGLIAERCEKFWVNHVVPRVPPDAAPSYDVVKLVKRQAEAVCQIPGDIVARWLEAQRLRREAEEAEEAEKALVLLHLGEAEIGDSSIGRVTFTSQSRSSIDTRRLKADHPEIVEKYQTFSTYRVMRFKAPKGAAKAEK
jgi:putative phage-type endonuclease